MSTFSDLLDSGQFVSGSVCVDCYFETVDAGSENPDPEWDRDAMLATLAVYDLTPGHLHHGEYADRNCFHAGNACEDDCDCEETTFSSIGCILCGSTLAGTRHDVILIERRLLNTKGSEE